MYIHMKIYKNQYISCSNMKAIQIEKCPASVPRSFLRSPQSP